MTVKAFRDQQNRKAFERSAENIEERRHKLFSHGQGDWVLLEYPKNQNGDDVNTRLHASPELHDLGSWLLHKLEMQVYTWRGENNERLFKGRHHQIRSKQTLHVTPVAGTWDIAFGNDVVEGLDWRSENDWTMTPPTSTSFSKIKQGDASQIHLGTAILLVDFEGDEYGDEYLTVSTGETVTLLLPPCEPEGWAFARTLQGAEGWLPPHFAGRVSESRCVG